ncbi:MAG: sulfurtransferase TusA family protein [Rhodospirillum sp.]|nr:sulfurtransferase TusA family protein [Rhodospirillum sp.]MCF8491603.1 sulfurtransferase TusA family protein [Rhodospirillum sp.]MCF8499512.1 sulfurtransferase TusA family protein [Rhodospirillum sp.]
MDNILDARGLSCPLPVLRARKTLKRMDAGQVLEILASDPGSLKDFVSFCVQTGDELLSKATEETPEGTLYRFHIRRAEEGG